MTDDEKSLLFILKDGYFWDESVNMDSHSASMPLSRATFKEQYKRFDLSSFELTAEDEEFFASSQQTMPLRMLSEKIDTIKVQVQNAQHDVSRGFLGSFYYFSNLVADKDTLKSIVEVDTLLNLTKEKRIAAFSNAKINAESMATSVKFAVEDVYYRNLSMYSYQVEYYNKFTFSLACLLFFFIGAPLGSIIRKGGIGIPLVITVGFFTFYFMLSAFGKNLAKTGQVSAFVGVWLATLVLIPICIVLTYKATVDSNIMSSETYIKFFKKVQTKFSSIFNRKK